MVRTGTWPLTDVPPGVETMKPQLGRSRLAPSWEKSRSPPRAGRHLASGGGELAVGFVSYIWGMNPNCIIMPAISG